MSSVNVGLQKKVIGSIVGRIISYTVVLSWTLLTILPLFWMLYSSFKTNEELIQNIYSFPHDLFDNADDEYVVIPKSLNVVLPYNPEKDPRERLIIESTTISPGRRLVVHFLLKEELPPDLRNLQVGDTLRVSQLPSHMRWEINWKSIVFNYQSAIDRGELGFKFINSLIYAGVSTFLIIFLGLMTSFALSKMPFKQISIFVMGAIGLGYLITQQSVIIPLFLMMSSLKLINTHLGIVIVYTAFGLPLAVLLATQFMRGLPSSLIESANIDGASTFRTFLSIIVPMSIPVIVTVSIISALGIWNEFLLVLVLASSEVTKSLPVGVFSFSSLTSTQLGWQLAALVIATAPAVIIYTIFNRRLTEGVVAGAVKG